MTFARISSIKMKNMNNKKIYQWKCEVLEFLDTLNNSRAVSVAGGSYLLYFLESFYSIFSIYLSSFIALCGCFSWLHILIALWLHITLWILECKFKEEKQKLKSASSKMHNKVLLLSQESFLKSSISLIASEDWNRRNNYSKSSLSPR